MLFEFKLNSKLFCHLKYHSDTKIHQLSGFFSGSGEAESLKMTTTWTNSWCQCYKTFFAEVAKLARVFVPLASLFAGTGLH